MNDTALRNKDGFSLRIYPRMDEDGKKKSQGKKKFTSGKTTELEQKSVESLSTTTEVPPTPAEVPERNMRYENADELGQSPKGWTESQVSTWLRSFGVKEQYIKKIYEEEVNGQILLALDEDFLKSKICMKSGPAHLIIQKRNELISSKQTSKEDCRPRPFDQEGIDFIYVKHSVLPPESGAFDLISPCREFKSFAVVAVLDPIRIQAKTAKEVLKFAAGCMNIRTNGTIHFGVMDSKDDAGYVHGEIIGIPVKEKNIYVDALDYIERSFSSNKEHVRRCVRPPRFIEVMDRESTEKRYVVEFDIVPSIVIVKGKVYSVRLPNFNESTKKVEFEKKKFLRRVGSKTEPVSDKDKDFYQRVKDRDAQREEAEKGQLFSAPDFCQDLGRKLKMLMTSGNKSIEKEKWFILVTNKFSPDESLNVKYVGEVIKRDACQEVSNLLNDTLKWNPDQTPVKSINIYQVLWKNSKYLRYAVVKPSYSAADVVQHAVELREYEEKHPQKCLLVLLLIEDSDKEYLQNKQTQSSLAKSGKGDNIVLDIDSIDSLFFPLIEHVCENEKIPDKAIELVEEAFQRFHEEPFFAQQLDRLQAKDQAETAAKQLPINSYILNIKGQVHKKYIQAKCKAIEEVKHVWESFCDCLKKLHKSMQDTLEWISEDLSYFQTDIGANEEET